MAKEDFGMQTSEELKHIYLKLTDYIHPLSLGNVYKSKSQIKMLAEKLLKYHQIDSKNVSKVISFLCSESGSHDYTIYRKEAKDELGLNIEKPNMELYNVIKSIYEDIENELELRNPFNINVLLATKNTMAADNKYYETDSNPYYLNLNNTAKEFSLNESSNPQEGILDTLAKFVIIENEITIDSTEIQQDVIFDDSNES